MIERQILAEKVREKDIEMFVLAHLGQLSCSHVKIQRTPLGEKISVYTAKPGLIVGRKGENIREITRILKEKYKMENPQIEVVEIEQPLLDAAMVAKNVSEQIGRFGTKRFKAIVYKALDDTMRAGAKGVEIVVGGRGVPGERAKSWRFSVGHLKKSGYISEMYVDRYNQSCNLRSGTVGVKVSILRPDVVLPDDIKIEIGQSIDVVPKVEIVDEVKDVPAEVNILEEVKKEAKLLEENKPAKRKRAVKKKEDAVEGKE